MFDELGRKVWEADISIYGKLRNLFGDKQACPFRWPGQYEDVETGLYYNRFRYYDPDAGQYCSQDPIGLAGNNPNLYAYVRDITTQTDFWGLNPKVFWSGGSAAQKAAENYARRTGGEVLEMTPHGKALEEFTKDMDWAEAEPHWKRTSAAFAGSAPKSQTKAIVFIDSTRYRGPDSVWEQIEKPILEKKGIRTEVVDIAGGKNKCP